MVNVETGANGDSRSTYERGPSLVGSLGLSWWFKRFLSCLGWYCRPSTNVFSPYTLFHFIFVPVTQQAGQAVVPGRLARNMCLWCHTVTAVEFTLPYWQKQRSLLFVSPMWIQATGQQWMLELEPRNRFQGIKSASLCSLGGRYNNPICRTGPPPPGYKGGRNWFLGSINVYKFGLWSQNSSKNMLGWSMNDGGRGGGGWGAWIFRNIERLSKSFRGLLQIYSTYMFNILYSKKIRPLDPKMLISLCQCCSV